MTFHSKDLKVIFLFFSFFVVFNKDFSYFSTSFSLFFPNTVLKSFPHCICMRITVFNCSVGVVIHNNGLQYSFQVLSRLQILFGNITFFLPTIMHPISLNEEEYRLLVTYILHSHCASTSYTVKS